MLSEEQRFWLGVNKNGPIPEHCPELGPCWNWKSPVLRGYGVFTTDARKQVRAHRAAWQFAYGALDVGLRVLHKCDNRQCVCESHLFVGTDLDNVRDMVAKERQARGERISAVLREEQVRLIRSANGLSQGELARRFGVNRATIKNVLSGRSWKHVF